jgi:hypothetical protein
MKAHNKDRDRLMGDFSKDWLKEAGLMVTIQLYYSAARKEAPVVRPSGPAPVATGTAMGAERNRV